MNETLHLKPSRAVQVIERVLRDSIFDEETLARELVIKPPTLARYRDCREPMPTDRQLCLALLLIERAPAPYKRVGYQLRQQVEATMRFEQRSNPTQEVQTILARRFP